jgi:hypothetical protein
MTGISMTNTLSTRKNLIGAVAFGLLTLAPNIQYAAGAEASTSAQSVPYSVGAEAGTTGIGANLGWRFANHFGVETGFDYFDYTYNGTIKDDYYHAKLRLESVPVNLELFPWKKSSFHLSLGVLINENRLTGNGTGSVNLGDGSQPYAGTLNLSYKPATADPYAGIGGNLYFDSAHHWSLMGALGVAYAGDGTVSLTSNPNPEPAALQNEKSKVQSYAKDLRFWPVIKLGVTYSF